jgi:hypothetical protein
LIRLRRSSAPISTEPLLEYALHLLHCHAVDFDAESSLVSAQNLPITTLAGFVKNSTIVFGKRFPENQRARRED